MNIKDKCGFLGPGKCWHGLGPKVQIFLLLRLDVNIRSVWCLVAPSELARVQGQEASPMLACLIVPLLQPLGASGINLSFGG